MESQDPFALLDQNPIQSTALQHSLIKLGRLQIRLERYLAEGGLAKVYLGTIQNLGQDISGGTSVVIKRILRPIGYVDSAQIMNEVNIMKQLGKHKNIICLYDFQSNEYKSQLSEILLALEHCPGGSLLELLQMKQRQETKFIGSEILAIFSDVCEALAHLHFQNPPIAHRDIKVENVLISVKDIRKDFSWDNLIFKLCDFGSATINHLPFGTNLKPSEATLLQEEIEKLTTMAYRAPEMLDLFRRRGLNEKVDIWAMGVMLYKLCYFTTPFEAEGSLAILNCRYYFPSNGSYPILNEVIAGLLVEDPRQRPDIYQLYAKVCEMRNVPCNMENINLNKDIQVVEGLQHSNVSTPQLVPKGARITTLQAGPVTDTNQRRGRVGKNNSSRSSQISSSFDLEGTSKNFPGSMFDDGFGPFPATAAPDQGVDSIPTIPDDPFASLSHRTENKNERIIVQCQERLPDEIEEPPPSKQPQTSSHSSTVPLKFDDPAQLTTRSPPKADLLTQELSGLDFSITKNDPSNGHTAPQTGTPFRANFPILVQPRDSKSYSISSAQISINPSLSSEASTRGWSASVRQSKSLSSQDDPFKDIGRGTVYLRNNKQQ